MPSYSWEVIAIIWNSWVEIFNIFVKLYDYTGKTKSESIIISPKRSDWRTLYIYSWMKKKNIGKGLLRGVLSVNPNTPVSPSPVSIHNIPYLIPPPPLPPRVSATLSCADAAVKGRKTRKWKWTLARIGTRCFVFRFFFWKVFKIYFLGLRTKSSGKAHMKSESVRCLQNSRDSFFSKLYTNLVPIYFLTNHVWLIVF